MQLEQTTTLAEFFGEYRALIEDGLTSNAVQSYARAWNLRVAPTLGALPLTEMRPLMIAKARALWTGTDSTKADAMALLGKILGLAVMDGLIPSNPCRSLPRNRGKSRAVEWTSRALDDVQVRRMLALTSFHPHGQRALAGLVFTGLRLGELVGLRWEDLNEQRGLITVRRTFSPDGRGRLVERAPKSGKPRQVPIIEELAPWLDSARHLGHSHIFTGTLGGPFDSGNLTARCALARAPRSDRGVRGRSPAALSRSAAYVPLASRAPRHCTRSHPVGRGAWIRYDNGALHACVWHRSGTRCPRRRQRRKS